MHCKDTILRTQNNWPYSKFIPNSGNNIFRDYLFYILPTISNSGDSKDAIKGKTLNNKSLNNLLIPLPPLLEQKRIVTKIELVNSKIKG